MKYFSLIMLPIIFSINLFSQNNEMEKVKLQLQWKYQFQFAGFIMAKENGYYKDVGLDVDILEYQNTNSIKELEENKIDFAINNSLLAYKNNKLDKVTLVATYFQRSPLIIITQPSIKSVLELKNKTIMMSENNRYNSSLSILLDYFNINNVNANFIKPSFNINDFIEKKVDAITAFRSNELFLLDKKNIPYNVIDPVEHGFTTNAINLFTSYDKVRNNPEQIQKFLDASKKGWEFALDNIEKTAKLIHEKYQPNKSVENLIYEGKVTKDLMLLNLYDIGEINQQFIQKRYEQLIKSKKLDKNQNSNRLVYQYNSNEKNKAINLSKLEVEYLINKREITMCIDPDWMPFEKFDKNGNHIGMTAEYYELFRHKIQTNIKPIQTKSWDESLQYVKNRKCDILSLAMETPERKEYLNFTTSYLKIPIVIATKNEVPFINNIEAIKYKSVGITKGYAFIELLKNKYKNLNIVEVKNIEEGLTKVNNGELFGYVGTLATISHQFQSGLRGELKIAGKLNENWELGIGVRSDDKILFNILEKVVKNIDSNKQQKILNNWISIKYEKGIDYNIVFMITGFFTIIIMLIIFWNIRLKKEIQKRIEVEASLKSTSDKLNGLYNLSPLGLALTDMDGKYIEFNDAFARICGYPKEELKTLDYWKLTPKKYEEDELVQLEMIKKTGAYGPYEKEYVQKDGTYIPIHLNGMIITNSDGKKYLWSIVEDITDRKRDENIMAQQSNLVSMGEMIGNIAHQWRQPLSVISTGATGLKLQKEFDYLSDEIFYETCDAINNNAQYLSKTIDDFTNFIKGDTQREIFNLSKNINSFISLVDGTIKSNNIKVVLDIDKNIEINGYGHELQQCLINIFNNAKDALDDTQTIDKYFFIKVSQKNKSVIIELQDNAGGINDDTINRIFEPYFTTKHQKHGTGIGLHMTYNLITTSMRGTIEVHNKTFIHEDHEYTGALFTIMLPTDL